MKLIIAEKASVAEVYAGAFGVGTKKGRYIECSDSVITWCIGHLVGLANADAYDERYKNWDISDLPIIPQQWKYIISADENKSKQYDVVERLMNDPRFTEVVCGTDAGREGELIFGLVYEKAGCKLPIKRLWISSMEEKAIIEGFKNLRAGADYKPLYHSALCRERADWIVGISSTRLFTKLYNKKLNVGRVQTPTLAMIANRGAAISSFTKEKYYVVKLNDIAVTERLDTASEAEKVKTSCDGKKAVVASVKREKKTLNPPKLYDLTTLQREANRIHGFTAAETLKLTQSLYEKKLVTYPRTDSRFITEDMSESTAGVINAVTKALPQFQGFSHEPDVKKVINNKKVTDHHAIIPTAEIAKAELDSLPDDERKVLLLIACRLLCATAPKHEYEAVTAEIECNGYSFAAKGKTVISDGWKAIETLFKSNGEKEENNEDAADEPLDLSEGQTIFPAQCVVVERFTVPPKHFTEDTLLSAMEKAGKEDITEDVERSGLGTPATRAGIIEKLITSGYIKRVDKNLIATETGAELVSLMPDILKSAKLTADWENNLALMAAGAFAPEKFMSGIEQLTRSIISDGKSNVNPDKIAKNTGGEIIGKCPRCKADVCETPKAYSCSSENCGFALWKSNKFFETARKQFTKKIAAALLKNGKVEVKGLYSTKKEKTYDAIVCLDDTGKYVNFKLEFPKTNPIKKRL
jgi:DNA topoisomerase-3